MSPVRGPELPLRYAELRAEADERIARQLGYGTPRALAERLARQGAADHARTIDGEHRRRAALAALHAEQWAPTPNEPDLRGIALRECIEALAAAMQEPKHTSKEGKAP